MTVAETKAIGRRLYAGIVNVVSWNRLARDHQLLSAAGINNLLQGLSLTLVAFVALPLAQQNTKALTGPLTDVLARRSDGGDFIAFYAAGRLYAEEGSAAPYDLDQLREKEFAINPSLRSNPVWRDARVNPYRNPPFYLPVLGYLAGFSLPVAFAVTTVIQGMLLGVLIAITADLAAGRAMPVAVVTWASSALAYYHLWVGFNYAQLPSYILAVAFTGGVLLLRAQRPLWAGLGLALLWVKLQYLPPLIMFLVLIHEWRALLGLAIGSLFLFLISLALVGPGGLWLYGETMVVLATAPSDQYFANYEWMFNWRGLLERALGGNSPELILPVQIVLTVMTYGLAVWGWTARTEGRRWRQDLRIAVLVMTMILASPHMHGQDMMLLLPAAAIVARHLWNERLPWLVVASSALGLLLFFWVVPQQILITPTLNFSVLLVAFVFLGLILLLRGDAAIYSPRRPTAIQPS